MSFLSADKERLVLGCPNAFFQEYLTHHYKAAIEEELSKIGEMRPVFFQVLATKEEVSPAVPPTHASSPARTPRTPPPTHRPLSKAELRLQRRLQARNEATDPKSGLNHKLLVSLLAVIEADEAEQDKREAQRQRAALQKAYQDQQAQRSSWWSDDKASPGRLSRLAEQIDHPDRNGPRKPNSG